MSNNFGFGGANASLVFSRRGWRRRAHIDGDGPQRPARTELEGCAAHSLREGFELPIACSPTDSEVDMSGTSQQPVAPEQLKRVVWAASIATSSSGSTLPCMVFWRPPSPSCSSLGDSTTALLKTFAVFAVAFAFRPLGGLVFGMLGTISGGAGCCRSRSC